MIGFIRKRQLRQQRRGVLLVWGAVLIGLGITGFYCLSDTGRGTVVEQKEQQWRASYDIVVRPQGSDHVSGNERLLSPYFVSGIHGGISQDELRKIKDVSGVAVAAPVSIIGYVPFQVTVDQTDIQESGMYRLTEFQLSDTGFGRMEERHRQQYFVKETGNLAQGGGAVGSGHPEMELRSFDGRITWQGYTLLAGIDFQEEAKLVGLDQAVSYGNGSRYFREDDRYSSDQQINDSPVQIPLLASKQPFADGSIRYTVERLDIPFGTPVEAADSMKKIKEGGGLSELDRTAGIQTLFDKTFTNREAYQSYLTGLTTLWSAAEDKVAPYIQIDLDGLQLGTGIFTEAYKRTDNPFPERWPAAFEAQPVSVPEPHNHPFPDMQSTLEASISPSKKAQSLRSDIIGTYDPALLHLSDDPMLEPAMDIYRSSRGLLVLDERGQPRNPALIAGSLNGSPSNLPQSPALLTTIEAAGQLMGKAPISAVRIKILDVAFTREEHRIAVEQTANRIREETGLQTDIIWGSSPQMTLVQLPPDGDGSAPGWMEQPWLRLGDPFGMIREEELGLAVFVLQLLLLAGLYLSFMSWKSLSPPSSREKLQPAGDLLKHRIVPLKVKFLLAGLIPSVPVAVLVLLIVVQAQPDSLLHVNWLGHYVTVESHPVQYLTVILSIGLAVLLAREIMRRTAADSGYRATTKDQSKSGWEEAAPRGRSSELHKQRIPSGLLIGTGSLVCLAAVLVLGALWASDFHATSLQANQAAFTGAKKAGDMDSFQERSLQNGSRATYNISLKMSTQGEFHVNADIEVTNQSGDVWETAVFYLIPNVFTVESAPYAYKRDAFLTLASLERDGQPADYTLEEDTLTVSLKEPLKPGDTALVKVDYSFWMPRNGIRFTNEGENYYLAQFYPMLATYHNGWNKMLYTPYTESYLTGHSDFTLTYDIPEGYQIITSSEEDPEQASANGVLKAAQVKELFVGLVKDMEKTSIKTGHKEIRLFAEKGQEPLTKELLETAAPAMNFFEKHIGALPVNQLDIIMGSNSSMEYPGVITILGGGAEHGMNMRKHMLVHELGHQWFYGVVSNDPYTDGWLDEGLSELAANLYFLRGEKQTERDSFMMTELPVYGSGRTGISNLPYNELIQQEADFSYYLYTQPVVKLWQLFKRKGMEEEALQFLSSYYESYQYKQVDTKEFVRFASSYLGLPKSDFDSWLKLDP
jgi:hypothetical protein